MKKIAVWFLENKPFLKVVFLIRNKFKKTNKTEDGIGKFHYLINNNLYITYQKKYFGRFGLKKRSGKSSLLDYIKERY